MSKKRSPHDKSGFHATLAPMTIDKLEPSLRDPVSGQPLRRATPAEVSDIRDALVSGDATADQDATDIEFDGLAISEDGRRAYPIVDGLIYLLPGNHILLEPAKTSEPAG